MIIGARAIQVDRVLRDLGLVVLDTVNGNYKMYCPWPENHTHGDRTGKFYVDVQSGAWLCFRGCGGGGGPLERLVGLLKGTDPATTRRWLLARASATGFDEVRAALPQEAVIEESDPTKFFAVDYNRMETKRTSSFILERGFKARTLQEWGFRYDPNLRAIVIPVYNLEGNKLVGIIRRMVPPVQVGFPKYLYPEAFKRTQHLFGANRHQSNRGEVILVEGPLDAVWLHQHGYTSGVALLGSFCSRTQQRLLAKLGRMVVLALDNDKAGWEATSKLIAKLKDSFDVRLAVLPENRNDVQELNGEELQEVLGSPKYGWELRA